MSGLPDTQPSERALAHAGPQPDEAVLDLSGRAGTVAINVAPSEAQ